LLTKFYVNLHRYPENNLFTLKKANTYWRYEAIACEGHRFIFLEFYLVDSKIFRTFAPDLVRGGSKKLLQTAARHAEKPVKQ